MLSHLVFNVDEIHRLVSISWKSLAFLWSSLKDYFEVSIPLRVKKGIGLSGVTLLAYWYQKVLKPTEEQLVVS